MRTTTLIYTSKATTPVTSYSLKQLAAKSASNNATKGVTGLLLYGSGFYFQVLEGNVLTVKAVYHHIRKDKRHTDCKQLCEHERERRLFPDWNMGQLNLDNGDMRNKSDWDLISDTLSRSGAIDWQPADPVIAWIREFMDHNRGTADTPASVA